MNAVLLCILVLAIDCVRRGAGLLCRLSEYPAVHCDNGGMFFARGMTAVISTEQISISSNAFFFVKLANTKISLPFGSYTNNKGVVQVPFIRVSVIVALLVLIAVFSCSAIPSSAEAFTQSEEVSSRRP